MFTNQDITQFSNLGISVEVIEKQINNFISGFPFMKIKSAASLGNGILEIDGNIDFEDIYEKAINLHTVIKFVPASGAASRMFKELFEFCESKDEDDDSILQNPNISNKSIAKFFTNISKFAFFEELNEKVKKIFNKDILEAMEAKKHKEIIKHFLFEEGMNYGNKPKGLLSFHKYDDKSRTSIEEHIVEAANYATSNRRAFIHFTVSPEHKDGFVSNIEEVISDYEKKYNIDFDITYSVQKTSTDTIAVDIENKPFRLADNKILFRPAGHGALIENLNEMNADIIFIKNIDNVVPDRLKAETFKFKKIIGGVLIHYKNQIFEYLQKLESKVEQNLILEIVDFLKNKICFEMPQNFATKSENEKIEYLKQILNRPIRVCGMVKNEGEPGGGPFWAENSDGSISLQVVEMSQIDTKNEEQKHIVSHATHFNPVDLVCYVKDYKGNKFDLRKYIDPQTGFISKKSKDGKDLKAQEVPGLWNGAMSDWNTIFVEVPIITFNPVKEVNDLLRDNHQ